MGQAAKELEKYKEQKANILCPTTKIDGLSEWHQVVVDTVTLSVNPSDGDVYAKKGGEGEFILTGQALQKLAVCAGIIWNPRETRATATEKNYVAYNAVGCIRKADGQLVCFQAEYDIDMDVIEDEIREGYENKRDYFVKNKTKWFCQMSGESQKAWINKNISTDLNFKRRHKMKLAATGAKNRVIRALLGIKKSYTAAELQKPFVMPRVILQPDYSDPEVKKAMMQIAIQSMTGVYGPMPSQVEDDPALDIPPEDFRNVEPDEDMPGPADFVSPTIESIESEATSFPDIGEDEELFNNADRKSKIAMIEKKAKAKGFSLDIGTNIQKPLKLFKDEHLDLLWTKLQGMEDDIPF